MMMEYYRWGREKRWLNIAVSFISFYITIKLLSFILDLVSGYVEGPLAGFIGIAAAFVLAVYMLPYLLFMAYFRFYAGYK